MVVTVIMVKVIPVFSAMYEGMGSKLPFPTIVCMALSNILIRYFWLVGLVLAVIIIGLRQYYKTTAGRLQIDALFLKIPIMGDLLRKVAVARFCRTLGTLTSSGVPILEGMDITARTSGNMVIQNAILKAKDAVEQGRNISSPLAETKVFPAHGGPDGGSWRGDRRPGRHAGQGGRVLRGRGGQRRGLHDVA